MGYPALAHRAGQKPNCAPKRNSHLWALQCRVENGRYAYPDHRRRQPPGNWIHGASRSSVEPQSDLKPERQP